MKKLIELGVSEPEAVAKTRLYELGDKALDAVRADFQRWSLWVPGRIEVLGKHTDYAGGRTPVCALERGCCVVVAPRKDSVVRVIAIDKKAVFETTLLSPVAGEKASWTQYIAT